MALPNNSYNAGKSTVITGSIPFVVNGTNSITNGSGYILNTLGHGSTSMGMNEIFGHAYEKGIIDYMNGCVDENIISKERMRKLKIEKL